MTGRVDNGEMSIIGSGHNLVALGPVCAAGHDEDRRPNCVACPVPDHLQSILSGLRCALRLDRQAILLAPGSIGTTW